MAQAIPELNEFRSRLLDLSLKNNLLNYKPSTARSIEVITELPSQVYKTLVLDEKGMKFHPAEKDKTAGPEEKNIWKYPSFISSAHQTDLLLETPYTDIDLRKRLYALQSKSRTVIEEQGYAVLYLALGFVGWKDMAHQSKAYRAPLLMIPVTLEREKVKDNYTLKWTGDDPQISLSLIAKLASENITLPDLGHPDSPGELDDYFEAVRKAVAHRNWDFIPDIALDLFSFRKFVMFKDLDPESWGGSFEIESNPLIKNLFEPEPAANDLVIDENKLDGRLKSGESYNILDADSSQMAVIEEAKAGKNLVVEGPPGTGKSQTIANLIAEMLACGKTVLFVSEKMAALEVVKRRLDTAGLSRFTLELHSQNARKTEFIRELERCAQHPSETPAGNADNYAKIDGLRADLTGYCAALKEPIGACGFTPYDLYGIREQYRYEFEDAPGHETCRLPRITLPNAVTITPDEYKAAIDALTDLGAFVNSMLRPGETLSMHPWAGTRPGMMMPSDRDEILAMAQEYQKQIEALQTVMRRISDLADIPAPRSETEISATIETCRCLTGTFTVTADILKNPLWRNDDEINRLINQVEIIINRKNAVLAKFTPDIFKRGPAELFSEFLAVAEKGKFAKMFSGDYKKVKAEIAAYYTKRVPDDISILDDLKEARNYLNDSEILAKDEDEYALLFGKLWKGVETEPEKLREYKAWVQNLLTLIGEGFVSVNTIDLIGSGKVSAMDLNSLFSVLEHAVTAHAESRAKLFARLGIPEEADLTFAQARKLADEWITDIDRLVSWSQLQTFVDAAEKTGAAPLVELLFSDKIASDSLIPAYLTAYADSLLREAYSTRPVLAKFSQIPHEQKIEAFAAADRLAISENARRIVQILDKNLPDMVSGSSRESEMGVLTGEFNRKRGHMSIRMLMTKSGGLIQKIKPCFMMSPLSVAQYLDPRSVQFDIIIFDEASQVKPEDALGALMRGKQLVVMGDSRQLPPTTFFDEIAGGDEEEEEESVASATDMESLLHVCKQSYPTRRLRWHYRSRHESLIAVSNEEFYDNSLMVFPSPEHETPDLGLSFVYLPDAVYERGKSGVNRREARAVAEAVIQYYRRYPTKTLGVATFSTKQQEAVRREVDVLLRTNPDVEMLMRPANGENFFVKNLETVQGDERDTILISVGYGFDENHRLSRNFGPLNQNGGERRLNVIITRARERCVVFCNFRGAELPVDHETSSGVAALSHFLTYAEFRDAGDAESAAYSDASSLFANTIQRMLEDRGFTVTRNLGCAGFRIDLAVAHPTEKGTYMAGILCDGPFYWSSEVTRDRDRLRLQVLKGLGWNILRIWSAEWFQHPASCTKVLLDFLEECKTKPRAESQKEMPAPTAVRAESDEEPEDETETQAPAAESAPRSSAKQAKAAPAGDDDDEEQRPAASYARLALTPYVICKESVLTRYHQFSSVPDQVLSTGILEIVSIEQPISEEMLFTRIKELGSVSRMTPQIKNRIVSLAEDEVSGVRLVRDTEGFYSVPGAPVTPREHPAKWTIDNVSASEIGAAAKLLLAKQYATPKDDLIRQTCLILGFKATAQNKERIKDGVNACIECGDIHLAHGICSVDG
ncbi:MAG TPA: DUF3320 domain-containing protein [Methanocorpusculum sp.]|nr:DUF3320 domain-containing protein [Methanocorpusculum sp.]